MKTLFLLVLAVLATSEASVVREPITKAHLNAGYVLPGDILLYRTYVYKEGIVNSIQYQDVVYRGNDTTRITAIYANEVGHSKYGTVWFIAGGIGHNNITVRFKSAWGYGFYYILDIWGRLR